MRVIYPDPVELGDGLDVTRCPDCAAIVHADTTDRHDAFHEALRILAGHEIMRLGVGSLDERIALGQGLG